MLDENKLIGLPLKEAHMLCEKSGLTVVEKQYVAPKPLVGAADARVIRVKWQGENIVLTYSVFTTDIHI